MILVGLNSQSINMCKKSRVLKFSTTAQKSTHFHCHSFRVNSNRTSITILSVQRDAWHWTDIKSLDSMSVCLSVCVSTLALVHESDNSFCPIFLKYEMYVSLVIAKKQVSWSITSKVVYVHRCQLVSCLAHFEAYVHDSTPFLIQF